MGINHSVCPPRTAALINRIVLQDDNHNHPSAAATTTTTSVGICNNLTTAFTVNLCLIIVVYRLGGGVLMAPPLVSMLMWIAVELQYICSTYNWMRQFGVSPVAPHPHSGDFMLLSILFRQGVPKGRNNRNWSDVARREETDFDEQWMNLY